MSSKFSFSVTLYEKEAAQTQGLSEVSNPHFSPFSSMGREPCKAWHYVGIAKMQLFLPSAAGNFWSNELKYLRKICPELNKGLSFTHEWTNIHPRSIIVQQTVSGTTPCFADHSSRDIVDHILLNYFNGCVRNLSFTCL